MTYRYEDLLETENRAAYHLNEREKLLDVGNPENEADDVPLKHRKGESYLIPNVWISGKKTIQDGRMDESTDGQPDLLRRVIPGSYILEELEAPDGYVRTFRLRWRCRRPARFRECSCRMKKQRWRSQKSTERRITARR